MHEVSSHQCKQPQWELIRWRNLLVKFGGQVILPVRVVEAKIRIGDFWTICPDKTQLAQIFQRGFQVWRLQTVLQTVLSFR